MIPMSYLAKISQKTQKKNCLRYVRTCQLTGNTEFSVCYFVSTMIYISESIYHVEIFIQ